MGVRYYLVGNQSHLLRVDCVYRDEKKIKL